jgi:DNA-3-methyladenine glycosylase I
VQDDRYLFEMLTLEGVQAGLSWITILKRREGYRRAFEGFDAERIASYGGTWIPSAKSAQVLDFRGQELEAVSAQVAVRRARFREEDSGDPDIVGADA